MIRSVHCLFAALGDPSVVCAALSSSSPLSVDVFHPSVRRDFVRRFWNLPVHRARYVYIFTFFFFTLFIFVVYYYLSFQPVTNIVFFCELLIMFGVVDIGVMSQGR